MERQTRKYLGGSNRSDRSASKDQEIYALRNQTTLRKNDHSLAAEKGLINQQVLNYLHAAEDIRYQLKWAGMILNAGFHNLASTEYLEAQRMISKLVADMGERQDNHLLISAAGIFGADLKDITRRLQVGQIRIDAQLVSQFDPVQYQPETKQ